MDCKLKDNIFSAFRVTSGTLEYVENGQSYAISEGNYVITLSFGIKFSVSPEVYEKYFIPIPETVSKPVDVEVPVKKAAKKKSVKE